MATPSHSLFVDDRSPRAVRVQGNKYTVYGAWLIFLIYCFNACILQRLTLYALKMTWQYEHKLKILNCSKRVLGTVYCNDSSELIKTNHSVVPECCTLLGFKNEIHL